MEKIHFRVDKCNLKIEKEKKFSVILYSREICAGLFLGNPFSLQIQTLSDVYPRQILAFCFYFFHNP